MLFAGDQRMEHMNDDFFGRGIHSDDSDPEHLFRIAKRGRIGGFATQIGLISKYGMDYPKLPYIVKLNSKTDVVPSNIKDPQSALLATIEQVLAIKKRGKLNILGVGYTIYPGSEHEVEAFEQASWLISEAHKHGLIFVLWAYPRGRMIKNERDSHLIAGAAGIANCLGADFVKVNYPDKRFGSRPELLHEAVSAAGRTGLVCAGGSKKAPRLFLQDLHDQIHIGRAIGNATGRNIHTKSLDDAVKMCEAISLITLDNASVAKALKQLM